MAYNINIETLKTNYQDAARKLYGKPLSQLTPHEVNGVIANVVKQKVISESWEYSQNLYSQQRIAIYFSIEFLIGRLGLDALVNTDLIKETRKIFEEEGIDINCLEAVDDPALGNGGLGRLAACFIESAATVGMPLYGVGLFYKYGLFKQAFDASGWQISQPDDWTAAGLDPWFEAHEDEYEIVEFQDTRVKAVPYVMPVIGYHTNAFPLMLWKAEPIEGQTNGSAAAISDWLYPSDGDDEGKILRIRQEYFFVSAMMQRIFRIHKAKHGTLDNIEKYYFFQMNDTHPVFGCLEFIRLLKLEGYTFDQAFEKAKECFAYTNHTIMPEALEKWNILLFKNLLPNVFKVVEEINQKLIDELKKEDAFCNTKLEGGRYVKEPAWDRINPYEMFQGGYVHMSRIACYVGCKINGVAAVHTEIIKKDLLSNWYGRYPWKFNNKTNGVTPRRWLRLANPDLAAFLDDYLGPDWTTDMTMLEQLEQYKNDPLVLREFADAKNEAKKRLAAYIEEHEGIYVDPTSIFVCQVKRIHEYKRQLMNALRILYIYDQLKRGNLKSFHKTTFIIGGKAAASYKKAIQTIALIKDIQNLVNNDPDVNDKLRVVFLTNFNVSYAEKVYAGANFSEQISTAGTEASGTGNMKFMMNGAPTIGTLDGANIEIVEEAGSKNNYIFGATVEELKRIKPIYNHHTILEANREVVALLDYLKGEKTLRGTYWDLVNTLLYDDKYFVMYDLESYINTTLKAIADYSFEQQTGDLTHYTRKAFKNTAHSGKFSSDRTILEYAETIWHIEPVEVNN